MKTKEEIRSMIEELSKKDTRNTEGNEREQHLYKGI